MDWFLKMGRCIDHEHAAQKDMHNAITSVFGGPRVLSFEAVATACPWFVFPLFSEKPQYDTHIYNVL